MYRIKTKALFIRAGDVRICHMAQIFKFPWFRSIGPWRASKIEAKADIGKHKENNV